jgi:16S rRNA processing protein RimM
MDNLIKIGFTKKPHGLKGEIKLVVEDRYLEDLMETELVLIDIKGKPTPFFIEDIIAKFEDVDTPELALVISSKELFIREQDLIPDAERELLIEQLPYAHCIGYTIYWDNTVIGTIEDIIEYPQQEMAVIMHNGREVLVPLNPHFVSKLDNDKKEIYMDLPEGILDL